MSSINKANRNSNVKNEQNYSSLSVQIGRAAIGEADRRGKPFSHVGADQVPGITIKPYIYPSRYNIHPRGVYHCADTERNQPTRNKTNNQSERKGEKNKTNKTTTKKKTSFLFGFSTNNEHGCYIPISHHRSVSKET